MDDFIAFGTQIRLEKPTKAAAVTCCDTIDGPVVKLHNGRVLKLQDKKEALKLFKEIKDNLAIGGFKVGCVKTVHSKESVAYKLTEKTKSIVITGDCDYDLNLIKFSKNSNLLLTECSFANGMKVKGHLIPSECGEMAKQANVGKLVLTHIYPTSSEAVRLKEAKKIFRNTIMAEDLLTIDI